MIDVNSIQERLRFIFASYDGMMGLDSKDRETLEITLAIVQKYYPKRPHRTDTGELRCPLCERKFVGQPHYCAHCGQRIDWEGDA